MKKFRWVVCLAILAFGSCRNKNHTTDAEQRGEARFKIQDDTLAAFLLGGIYTYQGYGGAEKTFLMVKNEMNAQPGEDGFVNDLDTVYRKLFEYPYHQSAKEKVESRKILQSWWDVHNEHEFHLLLSQLQQKGHQDLYVQIKKILDDNGGEAANPQTIELKKYQLDTGVVVLLDFVKTNYNAFGKAGIKAWDIARYVNVVCLGYGAEYIDRKAGFDYLLSILQDARKDYNSWSEYYHDFILGRRFWGGDAANNEVYWKTITEMQEGDYSVYRYLSFK